MEPLSPTVGDWAKPATTPTVYINTATSSQSDSRQIGGARNVDNDIIFGNDIYVSDKTGADHHQKAMSSPNTGRILSTRQVTSPSKAMPGKIMEYKDEEIKPNMSMEYRNSLDGRENNTKGPRQPKLLTAPQFDRVPIFPESILKKSSKSSQRDTSVHSPESPSRSRAATPRATSASTGPRGKKNKANLLHQDERLIMRMESFVPAATEKIEGATDAMGAHAMPDSRSDLIKMHAILDEMQFELREQNVGQQRFAFGSMRAADESSADGAKNVRGVTTYSDRGAVVSKTLYDMVFSDLLSLAIKKLLRVRKSYDGRYSSLESAAEAELYKMKIQLQEKSSSLHNMSMRILRQSSEDRSPPHPVSEGEASHRLNSTLSPIAPKAKASGSNCSEDNHAPAMDAVSGLVSAKTTSPDTQHASGSTSRIVNFAEAGTGVRQILGISQSYAGFTDDLTFGELDSAVPISNESLMVRSLAAMLQEEREESTTQLNALSAELKNAFHELYAAKKQVAKLQATLAVHNIDVLNTEIDLTENILAGASPVNYEDVEISDSDADSKSQEPGSQLHSPSAQRHDYYGQGDHHTTPAGTGIDHTHIHCNSKSRPRVVHQDIGHQDGSHGTHHQHPHHGTSSEHHQRTTSEHSSDHTTVRSSAFVADRNRSRKASVVALTAMVSQLHQDTQGNSHPQQQPQQHLHRPSNPSTAHHRTNASSSVRPTATPRTTQHSRDMLLKSHAH